MNERSKDVATLAAIVGDLSDHLEDSSRHVLTVARESERTATTVAGLEALANELQQCATGLLTTTEGLSARSQEVLRKLAFLQV